MNLQQTPFTKLTHFLMCLCCGLALQPLSCLAALDSSYTLSTHEKKTELKLLAEEALRQILPPSINSKHQVQAHAIDPRKAVPDCLSGFKASLPKNYQVQASNLVRIQCHDQDMAKPWQIKVRIRYQELFPVVVAQSNLNKAMPLRAQNLSLKYLPKAQLKLNHYTQIEDLIGVRTTRRVLKSQQITNRSICFVCKGDNVSIMASTQNFHLKTLGKALKSGNLNEQITVVNTRSSKKIHATVTDIGLVKVR